MHIYIYIYIERERDTIVMYLCAVRGALLEGGPPYATPSELVQAHSTSRQSEERQEGSRNGPSRERAPEQSLRTSVISFTRIFLDTKRAPSSPLPALPSAPPSASLGRVKPELSMLPTEGVVLLLHRAFNGNCSLSAMAIAAPLKRVWSIS